MQASVNSKKGFTLIELLVAISIIATLTAIVLPNFMGARERAKDTQKKEDMYALKNALRMVYNDDQSYPSAASMVTQVEPYMPSITGLGYGYEYTVTNNGDGFQLCVETVASNAEDNLASQQRCQVAGLVCGETSEAFDNIYVICGN